MKCFYKCLLVIGFLLPLSLHAQDKQGRLTGRVMDSVKKPLGYVTVSLYRPNQFTEPVKATYTNNKGSFEMTADTGKYDLVFTHVGFPPARIDVRIKPGDNILDSIILSASSSLMQNVTVTVRKPLIEQGDDRLTYNVESDPAAKSESASDLLRKTPMITVDGDGNVQLNGQSNFKILLNGRETSMFAQNVKDALRNFPGAVISKIEVITSPSAKYDAEGVGGIINIITKKKVIGYNGYLSSYYSSLSNYSESGTLNLKTGKLGISAYYGSSGSVHNIHSQAISETTPFNTIAFSKRTLSGNRLGRNIGGYGNIEVTYDVDSFKTIAIYGNLGKFHGLSTLDQTIVTEHLSQPSESSLLDQDVSSLNPNSGIGTDFIKKFRSNPDKELDLRFNGQFSKSNQSNNSFQDNPGQDRFIINTSLSSNHEYTVQVDFAQPLKGKQKIETGAKAILRKAFSDFESQYKYSNTEDYKPNPSNSDRFDYHQEVYSLYASYSFPVRTVNLRAGIRAEHTNVNGNFISSGAVVRQSYSNLIPNLLATKKFSSIYTLTVSYNMRLQRPYITNLNPFVNNNDSLNISYGNPGLGPQVLHAISVQNRFVKGKFFAAVNINSSYTNSMILQYAQFNSTTGVTSTTSANAGREFQLGMNVNLNTAIGEKLNIGMNAVIRYNHVQNKIDLPEENKGVSGLLTGYFYYRIFGQFTLSGSGGMLHSIYTLLNSPSRTFFYQFNFGYKLFKEKLALTMNVNNVHSRYFHLTSVTDNPDFRTVSTNVFPYRVIYFGATYNFGKLKENVSKKKGVTNDDLVQ